MYKNLKVIGDKCGTETVYVYQSDPSHFRKLLKQLSDTLQIQVMAVHVIRNPYDVIATNCFPSSMTSGINRPTEKNKFNDTNCLKKIVLRVIEVEDVVMSMKNDAELSLKILDIHNADYVKTPVETVKKICEFLEVDCPEGYLQACKEKAYSSTSKTRRLVVWPKEMAKQIDEAMKRFPFLQRYSYDND